MCEPILKFPVTCPDCALDSPSEMPIALLANALLTGKSIRLHSDCHDHYWTATFAEREQLRRSLAALKPETRGSRDLTLALQGLAHEKNAGHGEQRDDGAA
jgi:hypothetical protein